jgi:LysR family transcriptional regulator (chromosome initiation inhibitor)
MFPDSLAAPRLDDGTFMRVSRTHLNVPLCWQCWKLDSPMVGRITEVVRTAAGELRQSI